MLRRALIAAVIGQLLAAPARAADPKPFSFSWADSITCHAAFGYVDVASQEAVFARGGIENNPLLQDARVRWASPALTAVALAAVERAVTRSLARRGASPGWQRAGRWAVRIAHAAVRARFVHQNVTWRPQRSGP